MVYSNWFSVNHLYVFPSAQHFVFCKTLIFVCRGCQQKFFGEINQQKLAFDQRVARGANVAVFPGHCLPGALFPLLVGTFPLQPWNTGCLCLKNNNQTKKHYGLESYSNYWGTSRHCLQRLNRKHTLVPCCDRGVTTSRNNTKVCFTSAVVTCNNSGAGHCWGMNGYNIRKVRKKLPSGFAKSSKTLVDKIKETYNFHEWLFKHKKSSG